MLNSQRPSAIARENHQDDDQEEQIRDIHALTPPRPANHGRRIENTWETNSHRSSSSTTSSEQFSTMSREFNALVLAGSSISNNHGSENEDNTNLGRIGEDETMEETNPLAIVPDYNNYNLENPINNNNPSPRDLANIISGSGHVVEEVTIQRVKKEEVESKINAWQTAKISKINNRFKREDAIINGCESQEVQKATTWMKKVERKLEEKRAKAVEKMENEIAKARRKAEERRASAESKRGTKIANVVEIANLMKAVGRAPSKRSFF